MSSLRNPIYSPPMEPYLTILHRDDDLIVLDKPSGLLSVPGRDPSLSDSLSRRVQNQFPKAQMINRLDKDTSGIVLMSLNRTAHAEVAAQFEACTTHKIYQAIVAGTVKGEEGLIDLPLAADPDNRPLHRVDRIGGRPSQTRWRLLERLTDATRLELSPVTGRTHQLRVHLLALGHPILGDEFYAPAPIKERAARLLLHAQETGFTHPNGQAVVYRVPAPF